MPNNPGNNARNNMDRSEAMRGSLSDAQEEERKAIAERQHALQNESESVSTHLGPPTRSEFNFLRKRMRQLEESVDNLRNSVNNDHE